MSTHNDQFTLFPSLPEEIRSLIWAQTFHPRIIALHIVGNLSDGYSVRLTPPQELTALDTCRESRHVARLHGYREWKLTRETNGKLVKRDIIWNPSIDVVYMFGADCWRTCAPITLRSMFPAQAPLITRVALRTSFFIKNHPEWNGIERRPIERWLDSNVQEIIVVYDRDYEKECKDFAREVFNERKATTCPWSVPRDIEYSLRMMKHEKYKNEGTCDGVLPKVRVVTDERAIIMDEEGVEMNLRCWPPCQRTTLHTEDSQALAFNKLMRAKKAWFFG